MEDYEAKIREKIKQITPPSLYAKRMAEKRWANCAHPLGSLGKLERVIAEMAALTGTEEVQISRRAVLVFCADNGVVQQGVSQSESSVTSHIVRGLAEGKTAVCRMAAIADCKVFPIDLGVHDFLQTEGVYSCRIGNGTADLTQGAAMQRQQAAKAVWYGMEWVRYLKEQGMDLLATGEAGIGNTTTATAVACALSGKTPQELTGRGAGLSDAGLQRKISAIARGLQVNQPNPKDVLDVLAKVGGFDLGAMCGAFLGGAVFGIPVLMDGWISSVAALCAVRLCPAAEKAIFASHVSAEPGGGLLLDMLKKEPLLHAGMRLGEGTGAVAVIPLLDMALAVYRDSYTFLECGIEAYVPQEEI